MRETVSRQYCSCNEAGNEEVKFEYETTFLQWLFRKPNTIETYFGNNNIWIDSVTRNYLPNEVDLEVCIFADNCRANRISHSETIPPTPTKPQLYIVK